MAMTAAPAPASAHTNRWKVISSFQKEILREKSLGLLFIVEMIYTTIWKHWIFVSPVNPSILHTDVYSPHSIHTFCWTYLILNIQSSPLQWAQHLKYIVFVIPQEQSVFLGYRNGYFTLLFGYLDNEPVRKNKITATKQIITETAS